MATIEEHIQLTSDEELAKTQRSVMVSMLQDEMSDQQRQTNSELLHLIATEQQKRGAASETVQVRVTDVCPHTSLRGLVGVVDTFDRKWVMVSISGTPTTPFKLEELEVVN